MGSSSGNIGCGTICRCCDKPPCEECPLDKERFSARMVYGTDKAWQECCKECPPYQNRRGGVEDRLRHAWFKRENYHDFFDSQEFEGVENVVALPEGTCSARAARLFLDAHVKDRPDLEIKHVGGFEEGILALRDDVHSALLLPHLHPADARLSRKGHYSELPTQRFKLINPPLFVARPKSGTRDHVRELFALPALLPLVKEAYGGELPFDEIIPVKNTRDAANRCAIDGASYCVTNEMSLRAFDLAVDRELRRVFVHWKLYQWRPQRLRAILDAA